MVGVLEGLDYREVVMHGRAAKRTVRHFGLDYDYESRDLVPADPLPGELGWLRERCAELAERRLEELVQVLVSRYPAGAGIGWHRDAPMFGRVVGVSLGAPARMRFQRKTKEGERLVEELELAPRSAYLLSGSARWAWQHSIPATKDLRWSITFRTLREPR
ncbi:MAG: alpha-ketoglutarate-dependent dioxygenase AlkB [Actinomycetota bacterium]|nr:alpha-ketoglutarate-dependent dioxygenase AlkB [Actinomycetota bacterium]